MKQIVQRKDNLKIWPEVWLPNKKGEEPNKRVSILEILRHLMYLKAQVEYLLVRQEEEGK